MTWLVLAPTLDEAARWAAERLPAAGIAPLMMVTDQDLAGATWRHQLDHDGATTAIALADGRVIDSGDLRGTLNRLTHVPPGLVDGMAFDDRAYAHQELSALVLSWLASMPGPVVNPPDPRGLCGAWRPSSEWAMLAAEAGLCPAPVRVNGEIERQDVPGGWQSWPPYAPVPEDVIVAGEAVFAGRELDETTIAACRCLAARAGTPLLGLAFNAEGMSGATPLPDLRAGGDDLVAALAHLLDPR